MTEDRVNTMVTLAREAPADATHPLANLYGGWADYDEEVLREAFTFLLDSTTDDGSRRVPEEHARFRIDIEPPTTRRGKWSWQVWAWGPYYDEPDTEAWRPPWVALEHFRPGLDSIGDYVGTAKTRFAAELAAREYVALIETHLAEHDRRVAETIKITLP